MVFKALILACLLAAVAPLVSASATTMTLEDFYARRRELLRDEDREYLGSNLTLTAAEQLVNLTLMELKTAELDSYFSNQSLSALFPPSRNFIQAKGDVEKSEVFKFLRSMPKGGALHLHEYGMVSAQWIVSNLSYWDNLYMCMNQTTDWFDFAWFSNDAGAADDVADCDWIKVSDEREKLGKETVDKMILQSISFCEDSYDDGNQNKIWANFEKMIGAVYQITNYQPAFEQYFRRAYTEFVADKVQYVEFRTLLSPVCTKMRDEGCTPLEGVELGRLHKAIIANFTRDHAREFCGARIIFTPNRKITGSQLKERIELALNLTSQLPDVFIGMDLVGQEDLGKPLIYFASELLAARSKLAYYFHAGETNWEGEPTDINIVDAVLLGTKRIGHGYAMLKHPKAKSMARSMNITLEICPLSNQVLSLVRDLRNHPAAVLIQEGYPIIISSDDPTMWGAEGLSYDFYAALMAMAGRNMDFRLLKQLVINSLEYSSACQQCRELVDHKWALFADEFHPSITVR